MKNLDAIRAERRELANSRPRVIINNDGCDVLYYPKDKPLAPETFLAMRTAGLADKELTTVSYCTISSGFSNFTHDTRVGTVLTREMDNPKFINATAGFLAQGQDPLRLVVDFAQGHGLEGFWCFRMNDTHDAAHRPDKPYKLFPPLKEKHPEWLVGSVGVKQACGTWSSVDYGRPEIRQLARQFVEEVCQRYPVDGIELDFCRHLCYFKSVAQGGRATEAEIAAMNDLMKSIRAVADLEGVRRGRPILIAVRVPDDAEYGRAIGLDIEHWMANDVADFYIGSDYFQMRPWEDWVALGRRHGVKVFAGLSESRVKNEDNRFRRKSQWSYRARLARAWAAGVDGIYIFNVFNPQTAFFRECGGPQSVLGKTKHYFATVRDGRPGRYLAGGDAFRQLPNLTPMQPWTVASGTPKTVPVTLGEPDGTRERGRFAAHLRVGPRAAEQVDRLQLRINGTLLGGAVVSGEWLDVPVPAAVLRNGGNDVVIAAAHDAEPPAGEDLAWEVEYDCRNVLKTPSQLPWRRLFPECRRLEEIRNGCLLLADQDSAPGSIPHLVYPWNARAAGTDIAEVRLKVVSSTAPGAVCVRIADGSHVEMVTFEPGRVGLEFAGLSADFPAGNDFHTYRIVIRGQDVQVYADGALLLDGAGKFITSALDQSRWLPLAYGLQEWNRRMFYFGSASEDGQGEALWQFVRFRDSGNALVVKDFVLSVNYDTPKP
jgi:hypothetical protein